MSSRAATLRGVEIPFLNAFQRQGGVRAFVFIFGKICLISAVFFAYNIGDSFRRARKQELPNFVLQSETGDTDLHKRSDMRSYSIIEKRNIFGSGDAKTDTSASAPTSALKLRLVGTNVSPGTTAFAIIEDTSKKEQDVFDLNENVFGQAKLAQIFSDSVRIEHNGRIETLMLEDGVSSGDAGGAPSGGDESEYTVSEQELSAELANLPRLLSQARAVPYFRNGKSIGMRLFAIRRGSMYEKLGLRNGDIITGVNENSLSDPSQALKLFEQLKNERQIGVKLERMGEQKQLQYSIR